MNMGLTLRFEFIQHLLTSKLKVPETPGNSTTQGYTHRLFSCILFGRIRPLVTVKILYSSILRDLLIRYFLNNLQIVQPHHESRRRI